MIRIWQRIVGSKVLPQVVNEHMPLDPTSPLGLAVIGLGAFYLFMLAGTLPKRPRVSWLIPLVWFVLSFKGIRQGPLFAVCARGRDRGLVEAHALAPTAREVRRRLDRVGRGQCRRIAAPLESGVICPSITHGVQLSILPLK